MSRLFQQAKYLLQTTIGSQTRNISTTSPRWAEPPRKKRRVDPAVLRVRVERKMKKLEREIGRLERDPRQPIPILEYQLTNSEIRDLSKRPGRTLEDVNVSEDKLKAAQRLWNFYRLEQSKMETRSVRCVIRAQARALETLKELDEGLYNRTVELDEITLIPHTSSRIRKETAPNVEYTQPDGHIKDVTKDWVM